MIERPCLVSEASLAQAARCWARLAVVAGVLLSTPGVAIPFASTPSLRFFHLTVDDGLSNSWVRCTLKDHRGFQWIATLGGLDRYDGGGFAHYGPETDDPHTLRSADVRALFEDSHQRLWVGAGMLHLYDRERDRFDRHPIERSPWESGDLPIRVIREDRAGRIWVGTEGEGLIRYEPESGVSHRYSHDDQNPSSLGGDDVIAILCDREGRLWIGTRRGLDRYDEKSDGFIHVLEAPTIPRRVREAARRSLFVESLYEADDGLLWLGTMGDGLIRYDPAAGAVRHFVTDIRRPGSLSGDRVSALAGDGAGNLYIGVENEGLDILRAGAKTFTHYVPDLDDPTSLASASIKSLAFDDQGILWIGTYNAGLDYVSPLGQPFGLLRARKGGLSDRHVLAVIEDHRGDLWVGTDGGGLDYLNRRTGRFTYYRHDPRDPTSLGSDSVVSLLEDHAHNIWLGTWTEGLHRLDPRTGRFTRFLRGPQLPQSFAEWTLVEDRDGKLLVGLRDVGVEVFDPATGTYTRLSELYPGAGESGEVYAIAIDAENDLWIGSTAALEHVDRRSGEVKRWPIDPSDPQTPAPGFVYAIHPDSRGNIWVGTESGGLTVIVAGTGAVRRFTRADGLSDDDVESILEDRDGNLWLGTTRGLAKFERAVMLPEKPRFLTFDVDDGLQGNEFRHGAAFRGPSGEMFFGGQNGLTFFAPRNVHTNPDPPPVVFTALRVFNKPVAIGAPDSPLRRSITETTELTLSHKYSVLTFEFAALNFILPQKNRYAYKLEPFDPDWNHVGTRRTATYTNLSPGSYVLRVRASNNDNVWNEEGAVLRLRVTPPFYGTPWFRITAVLLAIGLIVVAHRLRVHRIRAHARKLAEKVAERTQDLGRLNAELQRLNEALEERVRERTGELEAEKERVTVTLSSIADGVIATDVAGEVVLMNRVAEELTGWAADEAVNHHLSQVLPLVDRETRGPRPDPVRGAFGRKGAPDPASESVLVRRDSSEVLVAESAAPIRDREGRIVGVVVVVRDVTEQRRVEQHLQSAQKLESLGVLAGGIAHDFNNLLTGVFGFIDLAHKRVPENPEVQQQLEKALAVLARARGLANQLLTFSKAGEPVTAPLSIADLLRSSVPFALSGSGVNVETSIAQDLWPCQGDERQVAQVIDNLLINARQAMPEGGTVELTAQNVLVPEDVHVPVEPGRYVRIAVRDHGQGVPPELRSRVFEPFFTTKATGSGLGLATAYSIVTRHGGHIDVGSAPGGGSTFAVYLPASSEPSVAPPPSPEEPTPGQARILIMDDEDYVRDVLSEMLVDLGYSVETVPDGEAAQRAFAEAHASGTAFDLVILDLTIPGGPGGLATLPHLRAIDPDVRAIAASGYSADPVMADPEANGFVATLPKPFIIDDVARAVGRALG